MPRRARPVALRHGDLRPSSAILIEYCIAAGTRRMTSPTAAAGGLDPQCRPLLRTMLWVIVFIGTSRLRLAECQKEHSRCSVCPRVRRVLFSRFEREAMDDRLDASIGRSVPLRPSNTCDARVLRWSSQSAMLRDV